jgi:hypothetical protein
MYRQKVTGLAEKMRTKNLFFVGILGWKSLTKRAAA